MWRHFPSRPVTLLSPANDPQRTGTRLQRLVLGERIVIARSLCHYETMTPPVGRGLKASQAVHLAAKSRTPIADPEFYFDWHDKQIGVWSWSRSLTNTLPDFEGEVIPETMLNPPAENATRLVAASVGYEGQVWKEGALLASRWWSRPPTNTEWATFIRAARAEHATDGAPTLLPSPVSLPQLDRPRSRPRLQEQLAKLPQLKPFDIAAIVLVLLGAPFLYLAAQWLNLAISEQRLQVELQNLTEQTSEVNRARQSAQIAASEMAEYSERLNQRHPSVVLATLTEKVSNYSIVLDSYEQNEDQLRARLRATVNFAPDMLVRDLEAEPLMYDVRLEAGRGQNEWSIAATLERP